MTTAPKIAASEFTLVTSACSHALPRRCRWASSYRHGRLFIEVERYVLIDEWHTHNYCSVYVVPDGATDPRDLYYTSDSFGSSLTAIPKDWICVYATGQWLADGPWQYDIPRILDQLRCEIAWANSVREREDHARSMQARANRQREIERARASVRR